MAIVTVCRGTKSGGRAFAECLAEQLDCRVVGREILQVAAADLGVSEEDLTRKFERAPKLWDRHLATRRVYVVAVQAALAEHVVGGSLVYHGLAGQVLLRGLPAVLRTRLIAPVATRVRTLMETESMDSDAAEQRLREIDASRARWVKMMYGERIDDPALYDMVINLETMSLPAACALAVVTVRQPEFLVTNDVSAALEAFRLACRVKLALVTADDTRGLPLEVDAHDGVIEISGSAPLVSTGEIGDRIAEIARSVAGVRDLRLKVQWFDPYP
jgi:cytidylate kinase